MFNHIIRRYERGVSHQIPRKGIQRVILLLLYKVIQESTSIHSYIYMPIYLYAYTAIRLYSYTASALTGRASNTVYVAQQSLCELNTFYRLGVYTYTYIYVLIYTYS